MTKLFGTDGIRGLANQYPMTVEIAQAVGKALGVIFQGKHTTKILIGKDTRLSGYMIETALASGLCSMGVEVLLVGPMPTPGVAFLTQALRADAGVMISASHNPYQDNGIKIFDTKGFKLSQELQSRIEKLVEEGVGQYSASADRIGKARRVEDAHGRYIEFIKSTFPKDLTLEGVKIVMDCAHGSGYHIAPTILEELGATVTVMGQNPDGKNINDGVGAVAPAAMAQKVKSTASQVGLSLDGDADRVVLADEDGQIADGDAVIALCATYLLKKKMLAHNTVVTTVMSNLGLDSYLKNFGGRVVRTSVGDRYVAEEMRKGGYNLGGESSGHIIFSDYVTTGDGLIAGLQILRIMKESGKKLSELLSDFVSYPQILTSVRVKERKEVSQVPELQTLVDRFEKSLGEDGRLLVRYSGTEPLLRIMVEGRNDSEIRKIASEISGCASKHLS